MTNKSRLRRTLNNPENCQINWGIANESLICQHYTLGGCYRTDPEKRPTVLKEIADIWNNTEFYGFLTREYIVAIKELCKCLIPNGTFPRLYYEYDNWDMLFCLEFHPGTGVVLLSKYSYIKELESENVPEYNDRTVEEASAWTATYNDACERVWEEIIQKKPWVFECL